MALPPTPFAKSKLCTRPGGTVAIPVVYAPMPELPASWTDELPRIDQRKGAGLRLYEHFVKANAAPKLALVRRKPQGDDDDVPSAG